MSALTLEIRPPAEQTAFNVRRWDEVLADPELQRIEGRVETDRHGRIIMSPPPAPRHGRYQAEIAALLKSLLPEGVTLTECPVSTADGVRAVDVAWASSENWKQLGNRSCFVMAPELCIEILSPSNTEEEIREKKELYFQAGAKEVWICGTFGAMTFFSADSGEIDRSGLCRDFPGQI